MNWDSRAENIVRNNITKGLEYVYEKLRSLGYAFSPEAVARKKRRLKFEHYLNQNLRVGYLDIECDGLDGDWATMLTWCIKEKGKDHIDKDVINRDDIINYRGDKRILETLVAALSKYDHIITWYGGERHYDLPMILTRCIKYNIPFLKYGTITQTDLWAFAKKKLRLSSNRLANVADLMGVKGKTPINKDAWRKGKLGHIPSLKEILSHNIGDVLVLEKIDERLANYHSETRRAW